MARIVLETVFFTFSVCGCLTIWAYVTLMEHQKFHANPEYQMSRNAYMSTTLITIGTGAMIAMCIVLITLLATGH